MVSILILPSPILLHFGIRGIYLLPINLLLFLFFSYVLKRKLNNKIIILLTILLSLNLITTIFWFDFRIFLLPFWIIVAILTITIATKDEISKLVDILSVVIILLIIGAFLSFFLALAGMSPIANLSDKWGTTRIYSYGFTLSNTIFKNIIRPAGIYDEPGAFSFFICVVVFLRNRLSKNENVSILILIAGLITFSITHVFFIFFYLISLNLNFKKILPPLIILIFSFFILFSSDLYIIFDQLVNSRLTTLYESGSDNERYLAFENCIRLLTNYSRVFFVGIHSNCLFEIVKCVNEYGIICCNPLEPLISSGIFISWPYYFGLVYLLISGLKKRKNLLYLGFIILFLQRPGIYNAGYS